MVLQRRLPGVRRRHLGAGTGQPGLWHGLPGRQWRRQEYGLDQLDARALRTHESGAMHIALSFLRFLLSVLSLQSSSQQPRRQLSAKVRRIKQRRLEELEAQAAQYGPATPPEITTEIDDLRIELETVNNLERGKLDESMQELLGRYDTSDQILAFSRGLAGKIRNLEDSLGDFVERFEQYTEKRIAQDEQKALREREAEKERRKQDEQKAQQEQRERSIGSMIMGFVLALLLVVLVLLIVLLNK